jgi:mannosyltransferase OCH1-like enzyme
MVGKLNTKYFRLTALVGVILVACVVIGFIPKMEPFMMRDSELSDIPFYITKSDVNAPYDISGVPAVIYHSWHSNRVPPKMRDNIYALLKNNPEFDYYLYSDDACAKYIEKNYPKDVLTAFHTLKPGAYKSDLWRYCILYREGGVYLDIKYNTLESLKSIISRSPEVFVKDVKHGILDGCFYNGVMISKPGNEVFKSCIDEIVNNSKRKSYNSNGLDVTGPCLLGRHLVMRYPQIVNTNQYFFKREWPSGYILDYIMYKDTPIMQSYIEYRDEQELTQKTEHYAKMWEDRNIYV